MTFLGAFYSPFISEMDIFGGAGIEDLGYKVNCTICINLLELFFFDINVTALLAPM